MKFSSKKQGYQSSRYHLKGKDDLSIIEKVSKIKRVSVEVKTMTSMANEEWKQKFPQVLGPLDYLTGLLYSVYEIDIGYCFLTNGVIWYLFKDGYISS